MAQTSSSSSTTLGSVTATINGQVYTLTRNSSTGKFEATITAPSKSSYNNEGHYYDVTIKAQDLAGNTTTVDSTHATLGSSLQLKVKEKIPPVVTIVSPTASSTLINNTPTIVWTVTDNDSGVIPASVYLTSDTGAIYDYDTATEIANGYSFSYVPTSAFSDGEHTIYVHAQDYDGNFAAIQSVTFKIDTVPPTLSVSYPLGGEYVNTPEITVTGNTNDTSSSPVSLMIAVVSMGSGTIERAATVGADGTFSIKMPLYEGVNTVTATATDAAGKTTVLSREITLDTVAPVITGITLLPNPVDAGSTYIITVNVAD